MRRFRAGREDARLQARRFTDLHERLRPNPELGARVLAAVSDEPIALLEVAPFGSQVVAVTLGVLVEQAARLLELRSLQERVDGFVKLPARVEPGRLRIDGPPRPFN